MATRNANAPAGPANVRFQSPQGGYKFRWVEYIQDFNLTGATVTLRLWHADNASADPDRILTVDQAEWNGTNGGLVVATGVNAPVNSGAARTGNADSSVTIIIPADFATAALPTAYFHLVVAPSGGIAEPYKSGSIEYAWSVSR